ncbi:MAG: TetR/AcrR family transcriptional regulator [Anaerolineae bacterium]|jgi:AcrR family transcriptional regulator|nr:TetR/AcrR family transcriptional regulator [Anaerolineae bacterium]MBT7190186.1 TetR/AcrR family transcriptional regulator [Anaerolineae bacterium]MBT7988545.1 TetR/AcrR family transcriptional regulator [Anaerolineae bacterium]
MSPHPRVGRDHILDTAESLFTEHGYKSASIREIARECGVTNAAIYYHFPNKESLFAEVMQRHAECLQDKMTRAGENIESPRERIIAILQAYIDVIAGQHAPLFMLRRNAKHLKGHGKHRGEFMQAISQPLVNALVFAKEMDEIKSTPSAEEIAAMMLGMLHGLAQQHRAAGVDGRALSDEDIQMAVNLFWEGIGA